LLFHLGGSGTSKLIPEHGRALPFKRFPAAPRVAAGLTVYFCTWNGGLCGELFAEQRRTSMDKDRVEGSAQQAKGKVKEVAGKALGDKKTETEGKVDQVKGKAQNAAGGLKDALRGE
jgi:uncharacterized protein YjbJ (UPF0337 family)